MPGSYNTFDILVETSETRTLLERNGLNEISAALADVQKALHEYVLQADKFALKYGFRAEFRDCASTRLLFFMGIT